MCVEDGTNFIPSLPFFIIFISSSSFFSFSTLVQIFSSFPHIPTPPCTHPQNVSIFFASFNQILLIIISLLPLVSPPLPPLTLMHRNCGGKWVFFNQWFLQWFIIIISTIVALETLQVWRRASTPRRLVSSDEWIPSPWCVWLTELCLIVILFKRIKRVCVSGVFVSLMYRWRVSRCSTSCFLTMVRGWARDDWSPHVTSVTAAPHHLILHPSRLSPASQKSQTKESLDYIFFPTVMCRDPEREQRKQRQEHEQQHVHVQQWSSMSSGPSHDVAVESGGGTDMTNFYICFFCCSCSILCCLCYMYLANKKTS